MKRIPGGRFAKNSLWIIAQDGYALVISLVVGVFSARYLMPDGYGLLNYSMSFVAMFAAFCELGLGSTVMKALVDTPSGAGRIVGSAMTAHTVAAVLSQLGLFVAISVIRGSDKLLLALTLIQGVSLFFDARLVINCYFQYRMESRYNAIAYIAGITAINVIKAALIIAKADIVWFALATLSQSCVSFVVTVAFFRRANVRLSFCASQSKTLLYAGVFFMLSGVAARLYSQIDQLMIGTMLSDADVGWYAVANYVALVGNFVPGAMITSAQPLLLRLKHEDEAQFAAKFQALVFGTLVLNAVLGLGIIILGPLAISLVYGQAYAPAGRILQILSFSALFAGLNRMRDTYLLSNGLNRYSLAFTLVSAGVNITLNAIMIPLWGVTGAAAATMCAYFATAVIAPLAFSATRPYAKLVLYSPARRHDFVKLLKELGREDEA